MPLRRRRVNRDLVEHTKLGIAFHDFVSREDDINKPKEALKPSETTKIVG